MSLSLLARNDTQAAQTARRKPQEKERDLQERVHIESMGPDMDEVAAGRRPDQEDWAGSRSPGGMSSSTTERMAWRRRVGCLLAATACCAALASFGAGKSSTRIVEGQHGVWTVLEGDAAEPAAEPSTSSSSGGGAGTWMTGDWSKTFGGFAGGSWANQYSSCRDSPAGCIGIDRGIEIFVPVILFLAVGAGEGKKLCRVMLRNVVQESIKNH